MNDEQSAAQFKLLMDVTKKQGFEHYEISNFSLPGRHSRHNSNYWQGVKYLGIGPSAHSFNGKTRQWNVANNQQYLAALDQNIIPFTLEDLSQQDRLNEYIMTALRTSKGLNLVKADEIIFGSSTKILNEAIPYLHKNWLIFSDQTLTLTRSGKLYADHIAAELFL